MFRQFLIRCSKLVICASLLIHVNCPSTGASEIFGLGELPGGEVEVINWGEYGPDYSMAYGVSADGSVVVGHSIGVNGVEAFRWEEASGLAGLGDLPGGFFDSTAYAVSADGEVVVGAGYGEAGLEAFRWTADAGMLSLGTVPGMTASRAWDVSADGSVIVGDMGTASGEDAMYPQQRAFRWTEAGGMVDLGSLVTPGDIPAPRGNSLAHGVSADGSVVVGWSTSDTVSQAFLWTEAEGMQGLGVLPGDSQSMAFDVSADGLVVVGYSNSSAEFRPEAFRWTEADGMQGLGYLPATLTQGSFASAVSGDGSITVGYSYSDAGVEAVQWTVDRGIERIADRLIEEGVDLSGWYLAEARDISDDGSVVVGVGSGPSGYIEAWIARSGSGLLTPSVINQSLSSVLPATESAHGLIRENLDVHIQTARHLNPSTEAALDLYAVGFGGEWHSYSAGGTVGLAWHVNDTMHLGAGLFANRYRDDDLDFSGEYEMDAAGGTLWGGYDAGQSGPEFYLAGMLANFDLEAERGYLNGSGADTSKGSPEGSMAGAAVRIGWEVPLTAQGSFVPFADYTWSKIDRDGYTESGGGFPARFDGTTDHASIARAGLEGRFGLSEMISIWGQAAYGKRFDEDSAGITGEILGLTNFSLPGYQLDDDWVETDFGFNWQATPRFSIMMSAGSVFNNDQNPKWRTSVGAAWSL